MIYTINPVFDLTSFDSYLNKNFLFTGVRNAEKEKSKLIVNNDLLINYDEDKNEIQELVLKPNQERWCHRAYKLLQKQHCYIDVSGTGYGKTPMTLWVAKQYNFKVLIICPTNVENVWKEHCERYDVEYIAIISFSKLISKTKKGEYTNPFIEPSKDIKSKDDKNGIVTTNEYKDLVKKGIFLIIDEAHSIKNNQAVSSKAVSKMIKDINESTLSRYALLSATLLDKEETMIHVMRLLGIITSKVLYNSRNKLNSPILDLIKYSMSIDEQATNKLLKMRMRTSTVNINSFACTLFKNIISKRYIGHADQMNTTFKLNIKNVFYEINKKDKMLAEKSLNDLNKILNSNMTNTELFSRAMISTQILEKSKLNDIKRVVERDLDAYPNCKIVVVLQYTESLYIMNEIMKERSPLVLSGCIPKQIRAHYINNFNKNPNIRLLLGNISVVAEGISLHDTQGDFFRIMYISPNYKLIKSVQTTGRIFREGSMSNAFVRFFYSSNELEERLMRSLFQRSVCLSTVMQKNKSISSVNEYESCREEQDRYNFETVQVDKQDVEEYKDNDIKEFKNNVVFYNYRKAMISDYTYRRFLDNIDALEDIEKMLEDDFNTYNVQVSSNIITPINTLDINKTELIERREAQRREQRSNRARATARSRAERNRRIQELNARREEMARLRSIQGGFQSPPRSPRRSPPRSPRRDQSSSSRIRNVRIVERFADDYVDEIPAYLLY